MRLLNPQETWRAERPHVLYSLSSGGIKWAPVARVKKREALQDSPAPSVMIEKFASAGGFLRANFSI